MDYKKIVKSRELRIKMSKVFNLMSDELTLKFQYRIKFNRRLDLKDPQRFTEKMQWYKLNYRNINMQKCADKFLVRDYIISKKIENTLNDLYGVYDSPLEIDFNSLPNQFVIKTTNGGGGINVILCKDKEKFNFEEATKKLSTWMKKKELSVGREWAYDNLKPRIIIEKFLENEKNPEAGLTDYKFFCFNGVPHYIVADIDRYIGHKRNFYNMNWEYLDVSSDCANFGDVFPKPEGLDKMIETAKILSEEFPFVRVDLYYVEGKVLFGEMTFYPWSGYVSFKPDEFDFTLGNKFNLPLNEI